MCTERNMLYHMSSFNEIVGLGYLKQSPIDFFKYAAFRVVQVVLFYLNNEICKTFLTKRIVTRTLLYVML